MEAMSCSYASKASTSGVPALLKGLELRLKSPAEEREELGLIAGRRWKIRAIGNRESGL